MDSVLVAVIISCSIIAALLAALLTWFYWMQRREVTVGLDYKGYAGAACLGVADTNPGFRPSLTALPSSTTRASLTALPSTIPPSHAMYGYDPYDPNDDTKQWL
jgi:hypothetical protein